MNPKILKKLNERVSFIEKGKGKRKTYEVYRRDIVSINWFKTGLSEWKKVITTANKAKALHRKHNLWIIVLGDLNLRPAVLERRKKYEKRALSPQEKKNLIDRFQHLHSK